MVSVMRSCIQSILKLVNCVVGMVGIAMVLCVIGYVWGEGKLAKEDKDGRNCCQRIKRRRRTEGRKKRPWSELPVDLLGLVSSYLFAIDPDAIGTIRLTCKTWGLVLDSIAPLPPPPFDLLLPHNNHPYLMSLKDHTCKFFHPVLDHAFQMNIPELSDAIIHFSKQSWLLLCRKDGDVFFYNPFSREKITLPKLGPRHDITTMEMLFLRGDIRVFDLKSNKFSIHGLSLTQTQLNSLYRNFLVQSNGELLIVFVTDGEQSIFVKGINISKKMVCRPLQKLSNKRLYISYGGSFSAPAMERAIGNKIYFPKILNNSCIFYSLATRKYHSFYGDYSSGIPRGVKEFTNCAWIERNYP
ncbi:unnamed protein product [Dovyalis caffra]|uniref:F-box domain-containing protein n=1 Tax=Dovyalis caffra TaxID=77055 RepID=A0AAV1SHB7_9ROSI|nr:unnamed protein product [Dovyalis caffra]